MSPAARSPSLSDQKDEVSLTVNGTIYKGWQGVSVKQGIRSMAGAFDLTLTDDWTKTKSPWPIAPNDACVVKIGSDVVISGFVDDVEVNYDGSQHSIRVAGRDVTCDLVDCSAPPGEYRNLTLAGLAERLTDPFPAVTVIDDFGDTYVFSLVRVSTGESVFEILDKVARLRGCLLFSDGLGNLVLGKPGSTRCQTALVDGKNILRGSSRATAKDRYSVYRIVSQFGGWGENTPASVAAGVVATASDRGVKRYRPLSIQAELSTDTNGAQKRANFEVSSRIGKSQPISITVEGHRQGDGSLWRPNNLVQIKSPWLGIFTPINLLIVDVDWVQNGEEGTLTTLDLLPATALQIVPVTQSALDIWTSYGVRGAEE